MIVPLRWVGCNLRHKFGEFWHNGPDVGVHEGDVLCQCCRLAFLCLSAHDLRDAFDEVCYERGIDYTSLIQFLSQGV